MPWNPGPEVAAVRDAAGKLGADRAVIVYTRPDGKMGYASYGSDRALCAEAKALAEDLWPAVRHAPQGGDGRRGQGRGESMSDVIGDRCAMALPDGREISLLTPDPALIRLEDVALGLARQYRWGGFGPKCLTVAEHSVMAAQAAINRDLGMDTAAKALLHDAHEYLLRDLAPGIKKLLPDYEVVAGRLQSAIERALGLAMVTWIKADAIHAIDEGLRVKEIREGYAPAVDLGLGDVRLDGLPAIIGFDPEVARLAFLDVAQVLGIGRQAKH